MRLLPSRFCESDRCTQLASSIVAGKTPGYDQCAANVDDVYQTIQYKSGASLQIIGACEVNELAKGVCRDMAHLGIACCRALSNPARIVVGYLEMLEPMDLHAWFEAYVGNRVCTFDSKQSSLKRGRVAIAYGRDATTLPSTHNSAIRLNCQACASPLSKCPRLRTDAFLRGRFNPVSTSLIADQA